MNAYVYTQTLRDLLRWNRVLVWLIAAFFVFGAGRLWLHVVPHQDPGVVYGQILDLLVLNVLALSAAIFSTMVVSSEVEQKTITYLLTRAIPRPVLLVSRTAAAATAIVAATAPAWLMANLGTVGLPGLFSRASLNDLAIVVGGAAAYTGFFVLLSLLVNRAMIWSLLFAFGWENFVPKMPGGLFYISIQSYLRSLGLNPKPSEESGIMKILNGDLVPKDVPAGVAWTVIAGICAATLAIAVFWFSHFEYSPREDAE